MRKKEVAKKAVCINKETKVYKLTLLRMILNLTQIKDNQIITPEIEYEIQRKRKLAVFSINCRFENKPDQTEIYCVKSNLVTRTLANPDQILCFITVKDQNISYNPPHFAVYNMMTNSFQGGFFYFESLATGEKIPIISAAL